VTVGYYDIECANWDIFVVGSLLPPGAEKPKLIWHDADALLDEMLQHPGVEWRAHYGGRYDALLLLDVVARRGWRVTAAMRGASVFRAWCYPPGAKKAALKLYDTHALAPVGLAKLSAAAGKTLKGEYDFERIIPGMDHQSAAGRELADYLTRDVLALRDGDTAWREVLREVARVEPRGTLGGTAWASAAAEISEAAKQYGEKLDVPLTRGEYETQRAGYYGGRCEVYRTRAEAGWRYDRNSSYPAALTRAALPVGRRRWRRDGWESREGTVWAEVEVRECLAPPLPSRVPGHLVFPTGRFSGSWTARELRYAVSTGLARVVRVERAYLADTSAPLLREWCLRVWAERVKRPAWNGLIKLLANSLTGKLAQRPETVLLCLLPDGQEPLYTDEQARRGVPAPRPLGPSRNGVRWWALSTLRVPDNARPEWAATLTSEAREALHAQLLAAGDGACYCDTDSVYATRELLDGIGSELGEWKCEGAMREWRAQAPKVYSYVDGEKRKVRGKGFPGLDADGFEALAAGASWEVERGVMGLRSAARGERLFERQHLSRRLHADDAWCGARVRDGDSTRAPSWEEVTEKWGAP
jgi:hypothetical protein